MIIKLVEHHACRVVIHAGDYLQKRGHLLQVYGDAKRPASKLLGLASRKLGGERFPASWSWSWGVEIGTKLRWCE